MPCVILTFQILPVCRVIQRWQRILFWRLFWQNRRMLRLEWNRLRIITFYCCKINLKFITSRIKIARRLNRIISSVDFFNSIHELLRKGVQIIDVHRLPLSVAPRSQVRST